MATTPRRSTRRRGSASNPETPPSQTQRLNGLFANGEWWCNCEPRKQTRLLQVRDQKKPTKGQWFFKCAERPGCGFFLWEDEARVREEGLRGGVAGQREGEVGGEELPPGPKTPGLTQRPLTSYGIQVTPGRRGGGGAEEGDLTASSDEGEEEEEVVGEDTGHGTGGRPATGRAAGSPCPARTAPKRKRPVFFDSSDDEDPFGELDSEEERQMVALADTTTTAAAATAAATGSNNPKTPTATSRTIDATTGLPTPSTTARTLFPSDASRAAKRPKSVSFEDPQQTPSRATGSSSTTATATQPLPSSPPTSSPWAGDPVHDPTEEIMALLRPHDVDPSTLQSIRSVLATSTRRARGVAHGRDSARAVARDRDATIARLQERVAALENKERMMHSQITNMKAGIMSVWQNH